MASFNQNPFRSWRYVTVVLVIILTAAMIGADGFGARYKILPEALSPEILPEVIRENRNRTAESALDEAKIQSLLYNYTALVDPEILERLTYSGVKPDSLSQRYLVYGKIPVEGAVEDVELLFTAFKFSYALYEYFGGDPVFDAARKDLIAAVRTHANNQGSLSKRTFRKLVLEHLGFIQDGHVIFAGENLYQRKAFFFSEQITFSRNDGGYYTLIRGERYELATVALEPGKSSLGARAKWLDGATSVENYIKLSVDGEGRLVYILGIVSSHDGRRLPVRVTLVGEQGETAERVVLKRKASTVITKPVTYQRENKDGILLVANRNTAPSTEKMRAELDRFLAEAPQIAQEKIVILDIRDHAGGQPQPALAWTETLAGRTVSYDKHIAILRTRTALTLQRNFVQWYCRGNESRLNKSLGNITTQLTKLKSFNPEEDPIWTINHYPDDQPEPLPNDTLLFVLMDRGTASAGEDFIHFLSQLENVVFVGENTRGMNISGEPAWGTLPNSGFSFQVSLDMTLSGGWEEGLGYAPDLWVDPGQALNRVLKFVQQGVE